MLSRDGRRSCAAVGPNAPYLPQRGVSVGVCLTIETVASVIARTRRCSTMLMLVSTSLPQPLVARPALPPRRLPDGEHRARRVGGTGVSPSLGLAIIYVGLLIGLGTLLACRWLARVERRRAAIVLGAPIEERYRPAERRRAAATRACTTLIGDARRPGATSPGPAWRAWSGRRCRGFAVGALGRRARARDAAARGTGRSRTAPISASGASTRCRARSPRPRAGCCSSRCAACSCAGITAAELAAMRWLLRRARAELAAATAGQPPPPSAPAASARRSSCTSRSRCSPGSS